MSNVLISYDSAILPLQIFPKDRKGKVYGPLICISKLETTQIPTCNGMINCSTHSYDGMSESSRMNGAWLSTWMNFRNSEKERKRKYTVQCNE